MSDGLKNDAGKLPYELVPTDAEREVVRVLAFGAKKYAPRGWEVGMGYSRLYGALRRHLTAWFEGEDTDPESGLPHLAHAACGTLFLLAYQLRGVGQDDRPGERLEAEEPYDAILCKPHEEASARAVLEACAEADALAEAIAKHGAEAYARGSDDAPTKVPAHGGGFPIPASAMTDDALHDDMDL